MGGVHDGTVWIGDADGVKCWPHVDYCCSDCREVGGAAGVCDSDCWFWM